MGKVSTSFSYRCEISQILVSWVNPLPYCGIRTKGFPCGDISSSLLCMSWAPVFSFGDSLDELTWQVMSLRGESYLTVRCVENRAQAPDPILSIDLLSLSSTRSLGHPLPRPKATRPIPFPKISLEVWFCTIRIERLLVCIAWRWEVYLQPFSSSFLSE